ncbi:hypothetical protein M5K25_010271 [Dendrobium thyrsiflorum]|uniref:Uncharacterized protein n=1 Tax=Dendrobium thyrsiflorum TaxID=117978 RepID=A0ABD0UZM9_DENTH
MVFWLLLVFSSNDDEASLYYLLGLACWQPWWSFYGLGIVAWCSWSAASNGGPLLGLGCWCCSSMEERDRNNGVIKKLSACDVEALKKCLEENKGDYVKCQAHIEAFKTSCSMKKTQSSKASST